MKKREGEGEVEGRSSSDDNNNNFILVSLRIFFRSAISIFQDARRSCRKTPRKGFARVLSKEKNRSRDPSVRFTSNPNPIYRSKRTYDQHDPTDSSIAIWKCDIFLADHQKSKISFLLHFFHDAGTVQVHHSTIVRLCNPNK